MRKEHWFTQRKPHFWLSYKNLFWWTVSTRSGKKYFWTNEVNASVNSRGIHFCIFYTVQICAIYLLTIVLDLPSFAPNFSWWSSTGRSSLLPSDNVQPQPGSSCSTSLKGNFWNQWHTVQFEADPNPQALLTHSWL